MYPSKQENISYNTAMPMHESQESCSISPEKFTNLYQELYPRIVNFVRSRCSEPEDVAQKIFYRLLITETYKEEGKLSSYIYKMAHHILIDGYRRKQFETTELQEDIPSRELSPEAIVISDENLHRLNQCIELLEPKYQVILKLYMAGCSDSEIYQQIGVKMRTYRTRKRRAIEKLKKLYTAGQDDR